MAMMRAARATVMVTRVAVKEEGGGKDGKRDGNLDKEGNEKWQSRG
jgi:hypothetical protein